MKVDQDITGEKPKALLRTGKEQKESQSAEKESHSKQKESQEAAEKKSEREISQKKGGVIKHHWDVNRSPRKAATYALSPLIRRAS